MAWSGTRLQKIMRLAHTFAADPVGVSRALPGEVRQWYQWHTRGKTPRFAVDEAWNEHLHKLLGAPWPCPEYQRFDEVMADIGAVLEARGWGFGRDTYAWYSDGDSCAVPCRMVRGAAYPAGGRDRDRRRARRHEPGRARGAGQNDFGHLWSIDLPFPFDHRLHGETGIVVTDACRPRWSYVEGSSKQRLPPLAAEVGHAELFIHDSLHTAENTLFEMEQAASAMPAGGVMLVDDIDSHDGFRDLRRAASRIPDHHLPRCGQETLEGMFGIAVNTATA